MTAVRRLLRRLACSSAGAVLVLVLSFGDVHADPDADALAKLDELSTQALETREAVTAAQEDLDAKMAVQTAADERHRGDLTALELADTQLAPHKTAYNQLAVMTYMGGRTDQLSALLTADSPRELIDGLSARHTMSAYASRQLEEFTAAQSRAADAADESEKSAAEARTAAEQAAEVRAELQAKLDELMRQIQAAESQYATLTPQQRAVVDAAAAVLPPLLPPGSAPPVDVSEALPVGVASEVGLQPNAVLAARSVSAQFPQIAEIGGVRPDSLPWHPSGLAIDIMIPNSGSPEGIALGDAIRDYALSNAGRLGLQDVIWRGTYYTPSGPQGSGYGHYDHVHITVTPR